VSEKRFENVRLVGGRRFPARPRIAGRQPHVQQKICNKNQSVITAANLNPIAFVQVVYRMMTTAFAEIQIKQGQVFFIQVPVPRNPIGNFRMIRELHWLSGVVPARAWAEAAVVDFQPLDCGSPMFQVQGNPLCCSRKERRQDQDS